MCVRLLESATTKWHRAEVIQLHDLLFDIFTSRRQSRFLLNKWNVMYAQELNLAFIIIKLELSLTTS